MNSKSIAILGGTGALGTGLARRWTQAGHRVIIGSRSEEKAIEALEDLRKVMGERGTDASGVLAMENLAAAGAADVVVLTVPFAHQKSTLEHVKPALEGKILIDVTVPLMPPKVGTVQLPAEGSAGQAAQLICGVGDGAGVEAAHAAVFDQGDHLGAGVLVVAADQYIALDALAFLQVMGRFTKF